jgi:CBS domain-containing protein
MTAKLFTCTRSSTTSDLMELMTERRVRHVPVVERGQLEGIISIGDIVKHRLAEMEAEQQAMHEYSAGVSTPGHKF